jgi:hypothetical protein
MVSVLGLSCASLILSPREECANRTILFCIHSDVQHVTRAALQLKVDPWFPFCVWNELTGKIASV